MARTYSNAPRSSAASSLFLGGILLVIGGAATYGFTQYGLPYFHREPPPAPPSYEGMVMVPVSAQAIPAYTRVTRDHILDPKTAKVATVPLTPGEVRPDMILDFTKVIGRVMKADKKPGYVFTEKDFYPAGTASGLTAAVPPGKRSFVLDAEKVHGIQPLKPGDHFDVVATSVQDPKTAPPVPVVGAAATPARKRATVRMVVQNGVLLTPVTTRQVPYASTSLTSGTKVQTKPVQEITIALDPDEIGPLTEALSLDATLSCAARSGQPSQEEEARASAKPPEEPKTTTIETIVNGQRQVMTFPEPPAATAAPPAAPTPRANGTEER